MASININSNAPEDKLFWLYDGRALKNLKELADVLDTDDPAIWNYHVAQDRNDFANWIEDVYLSKRLGTAIRGAKNQKIASKKIIQSIGSANFWSIL